MNASLSTSLILRTLNFVVLVGLVFVPFFINYGLVKTRGRENEKLLWMLLTLLFSWIITIILAIMKPKEMAEK